MGPPWLVGPVRLAVACHLPVYRLKALADGYRDILLVLAGAQAVSDGDAVVLVEEARRDRAGVRDHHPASIEEPQRSTARRHADPTGRRGTHMALTDQFEVPLLHRTRHLVGTTTRHLSIPSGNVRNHR
jgi:hypothetical protein